MTQTPNLNADRAEIATLIAHQFRALCWDETTPPDTDALTAAYLPGALLYSSARPAKPQTAQAFADHMEGLRNCGALPVLHEKGCGLHIWIAGGVAVALAGCEMHENQSEVTEDISAFLLLRNPDGWTIAGQAWDILPSITAAFAANGLDDTPFDV